MCAVHGDGDGDGAVVFGIVVVNTHARSARTHVVPFAAHLFVPMYRCCNEEAKKHV